MDPDGKRAQQNLESDLYPVFKNCLDPYLVKCLHYGSRFSASVSVTSFSTSA
jgi:hypothetical protein